MSVPMKKRHNKDDNELDIVYNGNIYHIPKKVADKYKVGPAPKNEAKINPDSVLADDLFADLDRKYTKAGVLLQGIRHREGLTQVEFAKKIDVTQSDLSKMESGKRPIGKTIAKRVERVFDINYRFFLE